MDCRKAVHSLVPECWAGWLINELRTAQAVRGRIFRGRATVASVRDALRRADPRLECRSLRKGALHALAKSSVPEEVLLLFSGHASLAMLRRYLSWGAVGTRKQKIMREAAAALGPPRGGGQDEGSKPKKPMSKRKPTTKTSSVPRAGTSKPEGTRNEEIPQGFTTSCEGRNRTSNGKGSYGLGM